VTTHAVSWRTSFSWRMWFRRPWLLSRIAWAAACRRESVVAQCRGGTHSACIIWRRRSRYAASKPSSSISERPDASESEPSSRDFSRRRALIMAETESSASDVTRRTRARADQVANRKLIRSSALETAVDTSVFLWPTSARRRGRLVRVPLRSAIVQSHGCVADDLHAVASLEGVSSGDRGVPESVSGWVGAVTYALLIRSASRTSRLASCSCASTLTAT